MFDGLKGKLGSFKRDVEEEVEETDADDPSDAAPATETDAGRATETDPGHATERDTGRGDERDAAQSTKTDDAPRDTPETTSERATSDEPRTDRGSDPAERGAEPTDGENGRADADRDRGESRETERTTGDAGAATADTETGTRGTETDSESEPDPEPIERESAGMATRAKLFATGKTLIEAHELERPLDELEFALLGSDVEMGVAGEILATLREELTGAARAQVKGTGTVVEEALAEALLDVISVGQFDFEAELEEREKPVTIVFTGVNGVGKTTTIAKLARYFERRGLSTVLANGDTYRAGANQQLGEHADALDKRLIAHEQGSDPAAVLYDAVEYAEANNIDVVLGDTAGRLHTSNDLMAQLEKIDRVVDPDMTLFVDEAVAGQDATERAREFNDAAEIDGAILAKADADSQGGAAISIAHVTGKPILFLGTGQGYDDIERFDPERLVDQLLEEGDAGGDPDPAEA